MKKIDALEIALTALHNQHGSVTDADHDPLTIHCDCSQGKALRKLVRKSGKYKQALTTLFVDMPPAHKPVSHRKKASASSTATPELVGV